MAALPKMIPLTDAVKKVRGATLDDLRLLVDKGKIKGASINGEIFVNTQTLPAQILRKEDTPEYKKLHALEGLSISIGNAARKYDIPQQNISRWKERGLIKVVGKKKNRILVDERDVAYCVVIYRKHQTGNDADKIKGHWLFTENGAPRPAIKRRHLTAESVAAD